MINQPPVDLLIKQLSTDGKEVSRYCLCVVAAKRARQILDQRASSPVILNPTNDSSMKEKEKKEEDNVLAAASKEIAEGKIKCVKD